MFCFKNLLGEDVWPRKSSVKRRFARNIFCQKIFGLRKAPRAGVTPGEFSEKRLKENDLQKHKKIKRKEVQQSFVVPLV